MTLKGMRRSFNLAARYVLKKNHDLYRRLALGADIGQKTLHWTPMSESEITALIAHDESALSPAARRLWELVRVRPSKWRLSPWGDAGGGFWVVGILGELVIWYNDIEEGFNVSRSVEAGVIAEYWCNEDELQHTMNSLLQQIATGDRSLKLGPPEPFE